MTRRPTPKQVEAQSQARNSFARIVVLGGLLGLLIVTAIVAMIWRPENVKDVLLVIGPTAAYMAGRVDFSRRQTEPP